MRIRKTVRQLFANLGRESRVLLGNTRGIKEIKNILELFSSSASVKKALEGRELPVTGNS